MTKLERHLQDQASTTLLIDSYDSIVMGCDTESPELDLVEFLNSLPLKHAVVFNRDLLTPLSY